MVVTSLKIPVRDITVTIDHDGEQHELRTYSKEYRSLMMLIYDRIGIEGFGECLGMVKCETCLVEITEKQTEPTAYERNEQATLFKAGHSDNNRRLSCQLMVDESLNGLKVKILL
ncbi:2Fe-2S iron-sulfur cluster binding domain-containing protein [Mucilaginibacter sp. 14171R-50]|uniref:2Fe-2S iron-sulfur cluster-binding protein n=1 Tax=Mucilaginibacter sp. 14171R-50 TaxID=2703789 RepID=UPI00138D5753|nr:2Fe-2S iron-sulfur cluster-binding protein [Mucilaginibacter sp. 14171R-50]QHS56591.1 2Fe-2S iron-sulfur cluster binding domain-containing protein [Mucilaginibacter sp. 14171R-50]